MAGTKRRLFRIPHQTRSGAGRGNSAGVREIVVSASENESTISSVRVRVSFGRGYIIVHLPVYQQMVRVYACAGWLLRDRHRDGLPC